MTITHWVRPYPDQVGKDRLVSGEFECWDTQPPADQGWLDAIEVRPAKTKPDYEQFYGEHYVDMTKMPVEITWPLQDFTPEEVAGHKAAALQQANSAVQAQLKMIDTKKARPMSDIALGNGDVVDAQGKTPRGRLMELEAQAAALRDQIVTSLP